MKIELNIIGEFVVKSFPEFIRLYDVAGHVIYWKDISQYEIWYEYDSCGRLQYTRGGLGGYEAWYTYDSNNEVIHKTELNYGH